MSNQEKKAMWIEYYLRYKGDDIERAEKFAERKMKGEKDE